MYMTICRMVYFIPYLFQDEAEGQGIGGDTVFFDAADIWLPEKELNDSANKSTSPKQPETNSPNHNGLNRNSSSVISKGISHRNTSPFQSTRPVNGPSNNAGSHSNRAGSHNNSE